MRLIDWAWDWFWPWHWARLQAVWRYEHDRMARAAGFADVWDQPRELEGADYWALKEPPMFPQLRAWGLAQAKNSGFSNWEAYSRHLDEEARRAGFRDWEAHSRHEADDWARLQGFADLQDAKHESLARSVERAEHRAAEEKERLRQARELRAATEREIPDDVRRAIEKEERAKAEKEHDEAMRRDGYIWSSAQARWVTKGEAEQEWREAYLRNYPPGP